MKLLRIFLVLLILSIVVGDSFSQDDPKPSSGNLWSCPVTQGETHALLIGINKYSHPNIINLNYCVQGAQGLAELLKSLGVPEENIVLMVDGAGGDLEPTCEKILNKLDSLTKDRNENDLLILSFAGHGAQVEKSAYFCPKDYLSGKVDTLIERKEVFEKLEKCDAGRKFAIIDACRGEMYVDVGGAKSIDGVGTLNDPLGDLRSYGYAFLASCNPGQFSWEDQRLERCVFTHFVIEGWNGAADQAGNNDGILTLEELYQYVMQNTRYYVHGRGEGPQVPMRGGEYSGDFALAIKKPEDVQKPDAD